MSPYFVYFFPVAAGSSGHQATNHFQFLRRVGQFFSINPTRARISLCVVLGPYIPRRGHAQPKLNFDENLIQLTTGGAAFVPISGRIHFGKSDNPGPLMREIDTIMMKNPASAFSHSKSL